MTNSGDIDWDHLIQEKRVHRDVYTNPRLFEIEMRKIWGGVWTYLCHESELPERNSFRRVRMGKRDLIVTRDKDGNINALYNRCAHRASSVCHEFSGKSPVFVCPYHGWSYNNKGDLMGVPMAEGYGDNFDKSRLGLKKLARVESFKGFIFGTVNEAMPSLVDYLGLAGDVLTDFINRAPNGKLELSAGAWRNTYTGNWKLAWDNAADMYHVPFAHRSLVEITQVRSPGDGSGASYARKPDEANIYSYAFEGGHTFLYHRPGMGPSIFERARPAPGVRIWANKLKSNIGDAAAEDLLERVPGQGMNINIFPNLMILASQVQVIDPLSVDKTQLTWYATKLSDAPKEANVIRMRIAEDFPTFGEVDDLEMFQRCWEGLQMDEVEWLDCSRGVHLSLEETIDERGAIKASGTNEHTVRGYLGAYKQYMQQDITLSSCER